MMRHAYLVMAHNEPQLLDTLLRSLDDERNDIFIHIDAKANFDRATYQPQFSKIQYLSNRIDGRWGDFSLVEIELALLRAAIQSGQYSYIHLLSGVDLPVKSQDFIHDYCQANNGMLFIGYAQNVTDGELSWRSQHRFIFSRSFQSHSIFKKISRALFARLQSLFHYTRYPMTVKKGAQWWSITSDFAKYLLTNESKIRHYFQGTYCPDELVVQTICWNSPFRDKIYSLTDEFRGCKRYIPWHDGTLMPFSTRDFTLMEQPDYWFARKFSSSNLSDYRNHFHSICK